MRQCLRLPFTAGPYRGWVHALLGVVTVSAVALAAAGLLVLWPAAVPAPAFAAAAWLLTGAIGLLVPVRRASVRLANGLLGTGLPRPLRPRRTATAAWTLAWTLAGGALAGASSLALFTLGLPMVWLNGGDTIAFGAELRIAPGAAGAWTLAAAVGAVVATVHLAAGYAALMRRLAPLLLGPGLGERLAAAEAEADRAAARNRLARDLHDSIGHTLTASTIQAAVAKQAMASDPAGARLAMDAIESASRAALDDLDRALGVLRGEPSATHPEPTLSDLAALRDRIASTGTELTIACDGDAGAELDAAAAAVPPLISREAYRIVQEGVTNALRHAPGAEIQIHLDLADDRLHLRVVNPLTDTHANGSGGRGLAGIAERIRVLGGDTWAGIEDDTAWTLRAALPLRPVARR
ncbi:histidine kinase [Glycomyces sp. NPDC049804]|uniref:sensor histidine kinase n=1 Tax=Glycomyces sp. NPDC049804 TaxID=3154363 RepID=UPI003416D248